MSWSNKVVNVLETDPIKKTVNNNFGVLKAWIHQHAYLEWIEPSGGVVCFPRFRNEIKIDIEKFYQVLMDEYKTYLGPGHWFEQTKRHFRLGFGWENEENFKKGLVNIDAAVQRCGV